MSRVVLEDRIDVDATTAAVRKRLLRYLDETGMRVVSDDDGEIVAEQGSQLKTRLLGGWFVAPATLPKRATVRLKDIDGGVRVRAKVEESLGFGIMDSLLEEKYERHFEEWLDDLIEAVR